MHPVLFQIGSLLVPSYGACAALGVLLALGLAQLTAKRTGLDPSHAPRHAWNMLVLAVFAALATSRLLLVIMNLGDLRMHPRWLLAVAMVHHPLLAAAGIASGVIAIIWYALWTRLPLRVVADCLAAPIFLATAAEQLGALLAGSDYGRETNAAWAVTYTSPLAARWSGTPLGVPLYPVQAYAAIGALLLAAIIYGWLFIPRRSGDAAGVALLGAGVLLFVTEMFRDWEGRGALLNGLIDIPQLVGLGLVLLGGLVLIDWRQSRTAVEKVSDV
jgi:phosphatidylglycerol:prolipoprotein diacylglycerol transferase